MVASSAVAANPAGKPSAASPLSSRLYLLAQPDLRSASPAEQAEALSLPAHGAASLVRDGGRVVVDVVVTGRTSDRVTDVRAANAEPIDVSPRYKTITAAVPERSLRDLAAAPGVQAITEVLTPMTSGLRDATPKAPISTCRGSVTSEADQQLKAASARGQFNVDGSGVKVGILSDSFNRDGGAATDASTDVATGDLPGPGNPCGRTTPVQLLDDSGIGSDEGRGMAQLVHDVAPGADLAFATAFGSDIGFANNIRALASAGADVIVDDVTYFNEPMFQDGPIAGAVNDVTAQGVVYYSSAANANSIVGGNNIGSWETSSFRSGGACAVPASMPGTCMDFNPAVGTDTLFAFTLGAGRTTRIILNWAEPWYGVQTDIDLYLLDGAGATVLDQSIDPNNTTPYEIIQFTNPTASSQTYNIAIAKFSGAANPRVKFITTGGPSRILGYEYPTSTGADIVGPTIFGHNGAANAVSTAAVPFNNSAAPENFSSRGPVTTYFGPVSGTTPAAPSTQVLAKPDLAATDGARTTFFTPFSPGVFRFFGTSAAAPHAAAVAALQLSANPGQSVAQVKAAQLATADPVGSFGANAVGSGLVDAVGAVGSNPPAPPTVNVSSVGPTNNIAPAIQFTTTGDIKSLTCSVDGGAAQACDSPYTPSPALIDGEHTLTVAATDYFGQSASGSGKVTIDTTGPSKVRFGKAPKRKTTKKKVKFTFSSEPGATFQCKLDRKAFKRCTSPRKVKAKKLGEHKFTVRAFDALGNAGASARKRWKRVPR